MKKMGMKRALMGLVGIAAAALFGLAVMLLWNWLMPTIFGLIAINYWQALGLLVLAKILFGFGGHGGMHRFHGHGHHRHGMHHHNALREKWEKMTPEQQKEFISRRREHMKGFPFGCGDDFFGMKEETKTDNE